ncbi:alpha/beta fold hydrolase [Parahalioglobus pacificus]|uniref:Alpha/beta hydrolase n=1 Tax=Parahalioglobus pacificus TaxID=930806 RepID=A0A918XF92_9GAMM|nr:alpha/beta hydrolase [Halioglobus pacificus]GHD29132.1 alpha/beta hydrolase [Halioglobus pacificus]
MTVAREMAWEVDGLRIAGLAWGNEKKRPLLALHGWLDNANSFARLAPLLPDHWVVAIDLTGHGRSAWRSPDATYNIWDDLPQILGVVDALGWEQFDLMGHSRGAIIAMVFAAACSQRVRRLVLLDAVIPEPLGDDEAAQQLTRFLEQRSPLMARTPRELPDLESATMARVRKGLSEASAALLVERATRESEAGLAWSADPRLYGASASKFTRQQVDTLLGTINAHTLLLLAREGLAQHPQIAAAASAGISHLQLETLPGCHHFHMEESVGAVADRVRRFLSSEL